MTCEIKKPLGLGRHNWTGVFFFLEMKFFKYSSVWWAVYYMKPSGGIWWWISILQVTDGLAENMWHAYKIALQNTVVVKSQASGLDWYGSVDWSIVPCTERVTGSIPSQGTYLGCEFHPQLGHIWEAAIDVSIDVSLSHRCFFLSLFFSPSSLFPISKKKRKKKPGLWSQKNLDTVGSSSYWLWNLR